MWALSTSPREVGLSLAHSGAFLRLYKRRRSADLSTNLRRNALRLSAKLRRFSRTKSSHYNTYYTAFLPVCQEVFDNFPKLIRQHICCQNILTLQHICCFHQSSKRHRVCATLGLRPQLAQFVQCGRSRAI